MQFKLRQFFLLVTGVLCFYENSALALGQVSRACQFSTIPSELKPVAAAFFYAVGADADVLTLPAQTRNAQATKWVLESLTTDYGRVRYMLFATRVLYAKGGYKQSTNQVVYINQNQPISSQWTAEQISDAMMADPKFSNYYLNRGVLYSARAGNPKIVDTNQYTTADAESALNYLVVGYHWYYDPVGKNIVRLADSQANTCNLGNLGLGTGLFNR